MGLSDRTLQNINDYILGASGIFAFGGLFYFAGGSTWWWFCIADLMLFFYKVAAKLDIALMAKPQHAVLPLTKGSWQGWFAWYPVRMDLGPPPVRLRLPGDWVFLRSVHRRWVRDESGTVFETHYAYRPQPETRNGRELV